MIRSSNQQLQRAIESHKEHYPDRDFVEDLYNAWVYRRDQAKFWRRTYIVLAILTGVLCLTLLN